MILYLWSYFRIALRSSLYFRLIDESLVSWDDRLAEDTASTIAVVKLITGGEVYVAFLTPAWAPGVLHNESFVATNSGVADSQHSVVQAITASALDDTRAVELEDVFISFDGDRDWRGNQGSLEGIGVLGSDKVWATVGLDSNSLLELAGVVFSSVWVGELEFETVVSSVGEGLNWITTIATVVVLVTVDDLLLREAEELALVDLVPSFQDTGGGESPAWTALALILDLSDGALASPVDGGWGSADSSILVRGFYVYFTHEFFLIMISNYINHKLTSRSLGPDRTGPGLGLGSPGQRTQWA